MFRRKAPYALEGKSQEGKFRQKVMWRENTGFALRRRTTEYFYCGWGEDIVFGPN
jgi:hypothetical protein